MVNVHGCNVKCGGTVQSFVKDYEDFTLKHMFDVTAQLMNFQDEIFWFGQKSAGKEFLETSVINW